MRARTDLGGCLQLQRGPREAAGV